MTEPCVRYLCLRPDHHRRRTTEAVLTTYNDCCAYCPANATEGHIWSPVPDVTLETLDTFGWVRGHPRPRRDAKGVEADRELAGATR